MGEISFGVKPGCLPLYYSVMLPSHHLHCLLLLPPCMGAPGLGDRAELAGGLTSLDV